MEGLNRNPLIRKKASQEGRPAHWSSESGSPSELQSFWQSISQHSDIANDSFLLDSLRQLGSSSEGEALSVPDADVFEGQQAICCYVNLPGCDPASLQIVLRHRLVRLSGTWRSPKQEATLDWRTTRQERPRGRFTKTIRLPETANIEDVNCSFEGGVLTLRLEKFLDA